MTIVQPKGATSRVGVPSTPTPTIAGEPIPNQTRPQFGAAADPAVPAPNAAMSQRGGVGELNRAPLAAIPTTPTKANGAAVVTSPVLGSDYAVQLTSERSESGAQAAFLALQAKYPNQLRGRQATIRRADLGAGGIYYRALVGPFVSSEKAAKLCSGLKAAGGDCVILKN
jgi:SPOR domain